MRQPATCPADPPGGGSANVRGVAPRRGAHRRSQLHDGAAEDLDLRGAGADGGERGVRSVDLRGGRGRRLGEAWCRVGALPTRGLASRSLSGKVIHRAAPIRVEAQLPLILLDSGGAASRAQRKQRASRSRVWLARGACGGTCQRFRDGRMSSLGEFSSVSHSAADRPLEAAAPGVDRARRGRRPGRSPPCPAEGAPDQPALSPPPHPSPSSWGIRAVQRPRVRDPGAAAARKLRRPFVPPRPERRYPAESWAFGDICGQREVRTDVGSSCLTCSRHHRGPSLRWWAGCCPSSSRSGLARILHRPEATSADRRTARWSAAASR